MGAFVDGGADELRNVDHALVHDNDESSHRLRRRLRPVWDDEIGCQSDSQANKDATNNHRLEVQCTDSDGNSNNVRESSEQEAPFATKACAD